MDTSIKNIINTSAICIDKLGTRAFFNSFFNLLEKVLDVDQCVIFQLDGKKKISCLVCRNFRNQRIVKPVAKSYIEEGYKSDPNLNLFRNIRPGEVKTVYFHDLVSKMDPSYRDHYFTDLNLIDKISIITAGDSFRYYINLYRGKGKEPFIDEQSFTNDSIDVLIAALIRRHYDLNQSLREEGPLAFLTKRERDVCIRVLQAKKSEEIAHELSITTNTVTTYRKRAYAKLGINSKRALFSLCGKD